MSILFQKMAKLWGNHYKTIIKLLIIIIFIVVIFLFYNILNTKESSLSYMDCSIEDNVPIITIELEEPLFNTAKKTEKEINGYNYQIFSAYKKTLAVFNLKDNCNNHDLQEKIKISYRGQSSLLLDKKQYNITFYEKSSQKNVSVLGMPASSKFVLNGTYYDKTILRNYLAYHMASQIMEYAPRTRFAEVYIKNKDEELSEDNYQGLFLLIEKIERDDNRVNISKADDQYGDVSFIIARDKIKDNDLVYSTTWQELDSGFIFRGDNKSSRTVIKAVYPSKQNLTYKYQSKIESYINDFETSLYSTKFKDKKEGYQQYIDVKSFITYEMINEIFKNIDGGEISTYFYKDIGGKLKAGPVWDFDLSSGNTVDDGINEPSGFSTNNTVWFERLFQDSNFTKQYISEYRHYRKTIWTDEKINMMIDEVVKLIDDAANKNTAKWYNDVSYKEEIKHLKKFFIKRFNWLDDNIQTIGRYES